MSNYGLKSIKDIRKLSIEICDCLGHGVNNNAVDLLCETAMAETIGGTLEDKTKFAGMGLTQFDYEPFLDLQSRVSNKNISKIKEILGVDIKTVQWEDLRFNPMLCLLFTRLHYLPFKEVIPTTLEGRAKYWKKYYNTIKGKGTVEHYLEVNRIKI